MNARTVERVVFLLTGCVMSTVSACAGVPIRDVVPDVMPGDIELAVIPQPKLERPGDRMIALGRAVVCAPQWDALRAGRKQLAALLRLGEAPTVLKQMPADNAAGDTLVLIGSPAALPGLALHLPDGKLAFDRLKDLPNSEQGYALSIRAGAGGRPNVIAIASHTPQGAFYAIQTLKQLTYATDKAVYVRVTDILDWPTFAGRGGKRTVQPWVYALKCNLHYEHTNPHRQEHFGKIWIAGIFPIKDKRLDATPAGIARIVERMKSLHAAGASDYRVHVDDQPMEMTPETDQRFKGDYHAAMAHLLTEFYAAMKQVNPSATLYLCPQTYWTLTPFPEYGRRLWAGRTPPKDFAIATNGPQVTSEPIPPDEVAAISRAFGASRPALIVDWHGRDKSFGPIEARQAVLADAAVGIAEGTGTATMRATRLDWGWNPEAYDRDRSLRLACREFAGLEHWKSLYELVAAFEYAAPGTTYQPRAQAMAKYVAGLNRCGRLIETMQQLPDNGHAGRLKLPATAHRSMPQNIVTHIEPAWKDQAVERRDAIAQHAWKEAAAVRTNQLPAIDGVLDEPAWSDAHAAGGFISNNKALPDNQQVAFRCLYDDDALYFGFEIHLPRPIDFDQKTATLGVSLPGPGVRQTGHDLRGISSLHAWHSMALMLDPRHTHTTDLEFDFDAAGRRADGRFDTSSPARPNGLAWNSTWRSAVKVAPDRWIAEIAIPWRDLGVAPRRGTAMGLQVWRLGGGGTGTWSLMPRWWGAQSPSQFGHLILK